MADRSISARPILQPSLIGGEMSDTLYGRVDIDRYRQSLALCENFIVNPHGGVENRPGSEFVALTKLQDGTTVRLVTFAPTADESYILEFGHYYIRVYDKDGIVETSPNELVQAYDPSDGSQPVQALNQFGPNLVWRVAQSFGTDIPASFTVGIVSFRMLRSAAGATPVVAQVSIWTDDGGGLPLAPVVGLDINDFTDSGDWIDAGNTLPVFPSAPAWVDFRLKVPLSSPTFAAGTPLHIVVQAITLPGLADNLVVSRLGSVTPHIGTSHHYTTAGGWTVPASNPTQDYMFRIFNDDDGGPIEIVSPYSAAIQDDVGTESVVSRLVFTQSVDVMTICDGTKTNVAYELRRYNRFWALNTIQRFVSIGAPASISLAATAPALAPTRNWEYVAAGVSFSGDESLPCDPLAIPVGANVSTIFPVPLQIEVGEDIVDHYAVYKGLDGTFGYIGPCTASRSAAEAYKKAYDATYRATIQSFKDANQYNGAIAVAAAQFVARTQAQAAGAAASAAADVPLSPGDMLLFDDENIAPDFTDQPRNGFNPFTEEGGLMPACVCYFQQRLVFANVLDRPDTLFMSEVSDYRSFQRSIPTVDDDAIEATLAQGQLNEIRFIVPMRDLLVLTTGAEHILTGGGKPVTPSNLDTAPVSFRGCGTLHPLTIGNVILFKDIGGHIREWVYEQTSNDYPGTDVGLLASHLFKNVATQLPVKLTEWCYTASPTSVVYAVRADGTLLSFTYVREQNVAAWARHTTNGKYRSIVSARNSSSEGETLYQVVERVIDGVQKWMIEKVPTRSERLSPFSDCALIVELDSQSKNGAPDEGPHWEFLGDPTLLVAGAEVEITVPMLVFPGALLTPPVWPDWADTEKRWIVLWGPDGKRYTMRILEDPAVGLETTFLVRLDNDIPLDMAEGDTPGVEDTGRRWELAAKRFEGLDHLIGETIAIRADDGAHSELVVEADGSVTLNLIANRFAGGLPFRSTIRTLPLAGIQSDIKSRQKLVSSVGIDVARTRGVWAGENLDDLIQSKPDILDPAAPATGRIDIRPLGTWGKGGQIYVQNRDPVPCSILAVSPEVTLGG